MGSLWDGLAQHRCPHWAAPAPQRRSTSCIALYDTITPEDMRAMAAKYFVDTHRTIVTLSPKKEVTK